MPSLFSENYTLFVVAAGAGLLGVVSGGLGCFAYLRRQSLLGDAISHAALPGIAMAFALTRSRTQLVLLLGAALAGWIGALLVQLVTRTSKLKQDAALGLMLSVFFGFGMLVLRYIQSKLPDAQQAGLDRFLFGQAAGLLASDVLQLALVGLGVAVVVALFWKELKLITFDPDFAATLGYRVGWLDTLLVSLLVLAIVMGLQMVGVVLMSAMVVAPAAAARQWTDSLSRMLCLAAGVGATAGVAGAVVSSLSAKLPTGPAVVIALSVLVAASLLFAPGRGILAELIRRRRRRVLVEEARP